MGTSNAYPDSYYARTASPGEPCARLEGDHETEVCIVGGGLAGLSTALSLAERGTAVAVLEARRVGWGASGRNGGFVGPGFSTPMRRLVARLGLEHARRLYSLSQNGVTLIRERIARYGIDCEPVVDGGLTLSCFDGPDDLRRNQEFMLENFGEVSEFWPRERVRAAVVSERYFDALFKPGNLQFHPLNYCRGLANALRSHGVSIFESSPAETLELERPEKQVRTATGCIRAPRVVVTCGGYINGLHARLRRAIVPVATYVIATEPLTEERIEGAIRVPYSISDNRFANDYYRRLPDRRILWGGRITVRRENPPDLSDLMLRDLTRVFPQLDGVRAETAWSGLMSYAVHKMPQLGELQPGVWYAMGFGGHGMNTTSMAGELLGAAIAEGDDGYRQFAPFGLIPTGGAFGAAAAQLTYWYYQLRDNLRS